MGGLQTLLKEIATTEQAQECYHRYKPWCTRQNLSRLTYIVILNGVNVKILCENLQDMMQISGTR